MKMKTRRSKPRPSPLLAVSHPGEVRIGPVLAIPTVLIELGVSPPRAFAQAGVDLRLFRDPESRMRLSALGRLLESCVTLTHCHHFGLLVGGRFDLNGFGPLGYLMRNSATVGEAIRSLLLHLHLHDRAAAPLLLATDSSCSLLGYSIYRHGTPGASQIYDTAITIGYKILRELCGSSWKPLHVQFSHAEPKSAAPYLRSFRSSVIFDAAVSGIAFASSWLRRPIAGADPALHRFVAEALRKAQADGPFNFADQVQGVLPQMVLDGVLSAAAVARRFAIPERTLRRRLEAERTTLQQLINHTRFELARQLLHNTGLTVSEIAEALQYGDTSAFSRAFRNWAKLSPKQWRASQAARARVDAETVS
jgi:AraC-like DNA-binding protein